MATHRSRATTGVGIYAEASVGKGKEHDNGITHAETTIDAADRLTLVSGNDTTIQGAQLKSQQVVANIGNNLAIRSEQDTDDFASKTMRAGGKVMVGITPERFCQRQRLLRPEQGRQPLQQCQRGQRHQGRSGWLPTRRERYHPSGGRQDRQ